MGSGVNSGIGFGERNEYLDLNQNLVEWSNMSADSLNSMQTTNNGGGSNPMSLGSSVGSNESQTIIINHAAHHSPVAYNFSAGYSVYRAAGSSSMLNGDGLVHTLMNPQFPLEMLQGYEKWTLDLRMLEISNAFAQGSFGKLYKGTYNGKQVAVKLLEKPVNDRQISNAVEQQFCQEVKMLATLDHPNIVKFIGACKKHLVYCIVTEYAKGGSLRQFLTKRQNSRHKLIPMKLAVQQALDIARGMAYIHEHGFIHRDLKSDNLLIAADKSIVIADFGAARFEVKSQDMTPGTGTYRWMAPEMIQHRQYNHKVDVYSFGIVLWELITGMLPFAKMTAVQAAFAVVNKNARPVIPYDCMPLLAEIMSRCWDANPDARPSFPEVVETLELAERELFGSVRRARFRCCLSEPMTLE